MHPAQGRRSLLAPGTVRDGRHLLGLPSLCDVSKAVCRASDYARYLSLLGAYTLPNAPAHPHCILPPQMPIPMRHHVDSLNGATVSTVRVMRDALLPAHNYDPPLPTPATAHAGTALRVALHGDWGPLQTPTLWHGGGMSSVD